MNARIDQALEKRLENGDYVRGRPLGLTRPKKRGSRMVIM
jgi:hypothetical protein